MSRFVPPVRTRADRMRDLCMFLATARPEMVLRATADELSARYGTPGRETEYHLRIAQQRLEGAA